MAGRVAAGSGLNVDRRWDREVPRPAEALLLRLLNDLRDIEVESNALNPCSATVMEREDVLTALEEREGA